MSEQLKAIVKRRKRRMMRVRKHLRGTAAKPRLSVIKTNKHITAQVIDDENGVTLFSSSSLEKNAKLKKSREVAKQIGEQIAEKAKSKKIDQVIFDRGPFKYHGLLAELADGARGKGLKL